MEIDPAFYAISILRHFAGEEPMPKYEDFGITVVQAAEVIMLIEEAIANCGGCLSLHSPSNSLEQH